MIELILGGARSGKRRHAEQQALASGLPVAAYPVTGPLDVLTPSIGRMDEDLRAAVLSALDIPREACRAHALENGWDACARQLLDSLVATSGS